MSKTYRLCVCHQLAHIVTDKATNGDVTGAAYTPTTPICSLEDLQRQVYAYGHHPVLPVFAQVPGHPG